VLAGGLNPENAREAIETVLGRDRLDRFMAAVRAA
jgi:phosphoribosylanthranilate isomerase